jgi:Family of unknown function (DUF6039)
MHLEGTPYYVSGEGAADPPRPGARGTFRQPTAQERFDLPHDQLLNSLNSGAIIVRTAQVKNRYRVEGRAFADGLTQVSNRELLGVVTSAVYEEPFGTQDRLTWLIHLRDLTNFNEVASSCSTPEAFAQLQQFARAGGADTEVSWEEMFVDGSFTDRLILPYVPGSQGTNRQ